MATHMLQLVTRILIGTTVALPLSVAAQAQTEIKIVRQNGSFVFSQPNATVAVGEEISWSIEDANIPHLLVPDGAGNDAFEPTEQFKKPDVVKKSFGAPGVIRYKCAIHPTTMKGTITVEAPAATN